ncbi:MAG: SRPBCC family protein [Lysobacteraceae bacterium]|nr:SRPBCC family protein [Xanthomonadaceae bacterium]HRX99427.1 SRPBCC family protein [Xanthomonadaceae bacterium]
MTAANATSAAALNRTVVERLSDLELVVKRSFDAPVNIVFDAWSKPEIFQRWWIPKSAPLTLLSCDMDVRTGGSYRLVFSHPAAEEPFAFFGSYQEVIPNERIVWTNEESDQGAVTTVTFEAQGDKTLVTFHERYPSTEALEEAMAGSAEGLPEQFAQLDALLAG